jgi:hypothetical protein
LVASFSQEEFINYLEELEFLEFEDLGCFIKEYYNSFVRNPTYDNRYRYNACISKYGHLFLDFSMAVIELRKEHDAKKLVNEVDQP